MEAQFGFLIYEDVEELDLVGPWEIINLWRKFFEGPEEVFTISQTGHAVNCAGGLQIAANYAFANCPKLDYLLVPGGPGRKTETDNPVLIDFINKQAQNAQHILSVCTGAFLLQKAGLLKGRKATTHHSALHELREFPEVHVVEKRFTKDQNIWTGAGVSSGIDLALALVAEVAGQETAGKVQLKAEYFPLTVKY